MITTVVIVTALAVWGILECYAARTRDLRPGERLDRLHRVLYGRTRPERDLRPSERIDRLHRVLYHRPRSTKVAR